MFLIAVQCFDGGNGGSTASRWRRLLSGGRRARRTGVGAGQPVGVGFGPGAPGGSFRSPTTRTLKPTGGEMTVRLGHCDWTDSEPTTDGSVIEPWWVAELTDEHPVIRPAEQSGCRTAGGADGGSEGSVSGVGSDPGVSWRGADPPIPGGSTGPA
jgi:hypothetical protein